LQQHQQALLMSERFAELLGSPDVTAIGRHELMGFADPIELYVPSQITPSSLRSLDLADRPHCVGSEENVRPPLKST
jgi:hypothetical protein